MPSSSLVGLSQPGMQWESKFSVGSEAGCSLLRMIRNDENISQGCQHLLNTYPATATAKHCVWNKSVKYRFIYTNTHALNHDARLSSGSLGTGGGENNAWLSELGSRGIPDTGQPFPTIDTTSSLVQSCHEVISQSESHAVVWGWWQLTSSCLSARTSLYFC